MGRKYAYDIIASFACAKKMANFHEILCHWTSPEPRFLKTHSNGNNIIAETYICEVEDTLATLDFIKKLLKWHIVTYLRAISNSYYDNFIV
jgi:hypothetical protein